MFLTNNLEYTKEFTASKLIVSSCYINWSLQLFALFSPVLFSALKFHFFSFFFTVIYVCMTRGVVGTTPFWR